MYFNNEELHAEEGDEHNLFEHMKYGSYPSARRRFPGCLTEDIPGIQNATIDSFRACFYRAMYRLLLAGAVLARAYMAPVFQARQEWNRRFFVLHGLEWYTLSHWEESDPHYIDFDVGHPREEDGAFLRQFPIFNYDVPDQSEIGMWRNREYETSFGTLASWIVEDGRKRQQSQPQDSDGIELHWAENPEDVGAVRELMLLMVAYDHFNSKFPNNSWLRRSSITYIKKPEHLLGKRTVSIVRFGNFQVEKVTMPTAFEDLRQGHLYTDFHLALEGSEGADIPFQFDLWLSFNRLHFDYGERYRQLKIRENPGSPPMLEFWHFSLRHYLNLGFRPGTFCMPKKPLYEQCLWWKEVGRGEIFLNPNWAPV